MRKQSLYSLALIASLLGMFSLSVGIQNVHAPYLIITIMADGSISPPSANITTLDDVTYTFTANMNASIIVQRSNIVIDGTGWTLNGNDYAIIYGLNLTDVSNVTISNVNVRGFGYGIYLQSSTLNNILNNNITFNEGNIYLGDSYNNTITGNTITNGAEAIQLYTSSNNTISGNNMSGNSKGVWSRLNSAENVISGNNITHSNRGIFLDASSNNEIIGNNLMANNGGIALSGDNNTLYRNTVSAKYIGIDLFGSYNTISGNNITNCGTGFFFGMYTVYNTVSGNNIENNEYGLYFEQASNHTIIGNDIANNTYGVLLDWYSLNMRIYHNTFNHNTNPMIFSNPDNPNLLDNGFEGNYQSDYAGVDLNHDGIGDTPHVINANNTDYYPLMGPFHSFNTSLGKSINVISNSTVNDFQYESPSMIRFHVSNTTANQTHGFCRVSIPYEVLSEPFNVTVDGANPTYWNYTLYDNSTHRWIYFEYAHSTREIVIIPESPSLLILPLFMTVSLLAALAYRKRRA